MFLLKKSINICAAGLVVFRENKNQRIPEILVIIKNYCHELPKGKCDQGESMGACAIRETEEETGLSKLLIVGSLGYTTHYYWQNLVYYQKKTFWYISVSQEPYKKLKPQELEQISNVYWVSAHTAATTNLTYPNQQELIKNFIKTINKNGY